MKFANKFCLAFCALLCTFVMTAGVKTYAASATVSFGTDKDSIKADGTFTLTIIADSSDGKIGSVSARVTYDESMLEVMASDEYINGDAGLLVLNDADGSADSTKNYEITFKALKKGKVKIECAGTPDITDEDGSSMSVSVKDTTINIGAPADSNADSSLATLDVNEGSLEPAFDPQTFSYTVKVPFETQKLYFDAVPTDSKKASVSVIGNGDLKVGANSVIVTVTAEDGSSTDYNITVMKESETDNIKPGTIEAVIKDSGFNVYEDGDGGKFIQNGNAYQVLTVDDASEIPAGFEKTKLNIFNKVTVTAYTVKNDMNNDYMLIYCENVETGDVGFYQYDRVEHTLQRYSGTMGNSNVVISDDDSNSLSNNQKMTIALVGAILCALVVILLILLIKAVIKIKGLKSDDIY